jgi:hypothetical protein
VPLSPADGGPGPLGTAALPRFLAHSAAGAAAGCALVHGLAPAAVPSAGTAALLAACLLCSVHLWRRPGRAAWGAHVVLTTAMLTAHLPVPGEHAHHVLAHSVPVGPAAGGLAAWAGPAAGLLAVVALLLAAVRGVVAVRAAATAPAPQSPASPLDGLRGPRVPHA